jgi:amidophosphoribosyltransferase
MKPFSRIVLARCGIIGIFGRSGSVAADLYEGLLMLQHRGQDSAGMVTTDWDKFVEYKGNGLVRDVFKQEKVMNSLQGTSSLFHTFLHLRSST